jgi:hypothetical protein
VNQCRFPPEVREWSLGGDVEGRPHGVFALTRAHICHPYASVCDDARSLYDHPRRARPDDRWAKWSTECRRGAPRSTAHSRHHRNADRASRPRVLSVAVLWTARKLDARFSITVRSDPRSARRSWRSRSRRGFGVPYWLSKPEVAVAEVAEVAEMAYTCIARTRHPMTVRLVVRRVRPTRDSQLACSAPGTTTRSPPTGTASGSRSRKGAGSRCRRVGCTDDHHGDGFACTGEGLLVLSPVPVYGLRRKRHGIELGRYLVQHC